MRKILICLFIFSPMHYLYAENTLLAWFRPYGSGTLTVKQEKMGYCGGQSQIIRREDAWRCETDGQILDPCFINPLGNRQEAICAQSPWDTTSIKLKLNLIVDNRHHQLLDMSKTYPWGIELENGEHCVAIVTEERVDNLPVIYRCANAVLIGHVQRCDPSWKMLMHNGKHIETVSITKAWF